MRSFGTNSSTVDVMVMPNVFHLKMEPSFFRSLFGMISMFLAFLYHVGQSIQTTGEIT